MGPSILKPPLGRPGTRAGLGQRRETPSLKTGLSGVPIKVVEGGGGNGWKRGGYVILPTEMRGDSGSVSLGGWQWVFYQVLVGSR